ncbi:MAG: hypothetical protein Q8844_02760, partial [Pigeon pea little leaf phytoplasma]|nr:hypothetical protein [Pigeon pea little leaf phytoplasma]
LTDRLKAEHCENCDKTTQLQIHHIGTIRNAHYHSIMNKRIKVLCKDYLFKLDLIFIYLI